MEGLLSVNEAIQYVLSAVMGGLAPFLFEKFKGTSFGSPNFISLATGVAGGITAIGTNFVLTHLGFGSDFSSGQLMLMGFGVTETTSQVVYRKFIKNKKK